MPEPRGRLQVAERSYPDRPAIERHPFVQVVLPQRGRLEMEIAGERGVAGETRFALVPTGAEHRYWADGPNRFLIRDIPSELIEVTQHRLEESANTPSGHFPVIDERLAAFGSLLRVELARGDLADPLIAESLGLYAASIILRPQATPLPAVETSSSGRLATRTRDFLDAAYLEQVSLREIAAAVGASVSHVQRSFRAHFGISIVAYLQGCRLERAKELLLASELSIVEVALASGFGDHSYFTRLFRREIGLAPSHYRALIQSGSDKNAR